MKWNLAFVCQAIVHTVLVVLSFLFFLSAYRSYLWKKKKYFKQLHLLDKDFFLHFKMALKKVFTNIFPGASVTKKKKKEKKVEFICTACMTFFPVGWTDADPRGC